MKFLNSIDLAKNQIMNVAAQNLGTAPSSPVAGQFYYDTGTSKFGYWNGSAWVYPITSGSGLANAYASITDGTTTATASGGDTVRFRSSDSSITATVQNNDATYGDNLNLVVNPANVTHNSLGGLTTGDPHTQYTLASGTRAFTGNISHGGFLITNVGTPSSSTDAATKGYVDGKIQGLAYKDPVVALSTSNIASLSGTTTIDGVSVVAGNRVLLTGQSTGSQNGIWVIAAGAWTRPVDYTGTVPADAYVFVQQGTVNADTGWVLSTDGTITVDTTATTWVQFSAAGQITASNVGTGQGVFKAKSGNTLQMYNLKDAGGSRITIALSTNDITFDVNAANIDKNTLGGSSLTVANGGTGTNTAGVAAAHNIGAMARFAATIGDGSSTSITVTHNLGTTDVIVQFQDFNTPPNQVQADVQYNSTTQITAVFATAPASNSIRVIVIG